MSASDAAIALRRAEDALRAQGLTGGRAFEVLLGALRAHLGDDHPPDPRSAGLLDGVPTDGVDLLGLAYERFFADLFKGSRGQFFTPPPLVEFVLALANVGPGDDVLDPTCGSGGFLVRAAARGAAVRGIERDPLLADLASINLRLGGNAGDVRCADFFAADPVPADVVVANPPFSVAITDRAVLDRYALGRDRDRAVSDALFAEALGGWVRPGGRAAVILPWSAIANRGAAPVRAILDEAFVREAVVSLPEGVFRPFGGAAGRAAVVVLRRRPAAERATRYAEVVDPGWDPRRSQFISTPGREFEALVEGCGWTDIDGWLPLRQRAGGATRPLREIAGLSTAVIDRKRPGDYQAVDLADVDRVTGEVISGAVVPGAELVGAKTAIAVGDVLVSKLRPELGTIGVAARPIAGDQPMVGSSEWVALASELPHFVAHALKTPAWRGSLAVTDGQTRPRTTRDAVLASDVAWPGDALARQIEGVAAAIHHERRALRARLVALQAAMDAFAAGSLDEKGLQTAVDALTPPEG